MRARELTEHPLGLTWVSDDAMARASHALAHDGRVWLVDPVDVPEAIERATALGEPAGVIQLFMGHNRDSQALAGRFGVPFHKVPAALPDTPFSVLGLNFGPLWKEVALWWPEPKGLIVGESIGTSSLFALGPGPAGVHPMRRALPPNSLRSLEPEQLLVGHGSPVLDGAAAALLDALARSRRDLPKLLAKTPEMVRVIRSRP